MSNSDDRVCNEIIINGEVQLSTRNNTVTEDTLVQNETAQNKAGQSIQGKLDPVSKSEAYLVKDEVGDIDDNDYIPFNDVSDSVKPKKKTLFSNIIEKLKKVFATKTGNNIEDKSTFRENIETIEYLGEPIPAEADLNDYATAGNYSIPSDAIAETLVHCPTDLCAKLLVFENGNSGISQIILANHNPHIYYRTKFSSTWYDWIDLTEGGSGEGTVNGYATGVVSGSAITATITGFQLKAGVIVSIESGMPENATLNINDTGAKTIVWRYANPISKGDTVYDRHSIYTYMYDGTYYRIIANHFSPIISVNNYVANTSGKLELNFGYNSDKAQLIHDISAERFAHNYYKNSTWSGAKYLAYLNDLETYANLTTTKEITSGDLNDYKTAGTFEYGAGSSSNIAHVPSSGYAGYLFVTQMSASRVKQIIIDRDRNYIYERTYNFDSNNTWTGWVRVSTGWHTYDLGTAIPENADLNTYATEGVYYCQLSATAQTMSHLPYTGADRQAFKLIVMKDRNNTNLVQWYIPYDATTGGKRIAYRRTDDGGTNWNDWVYLARSIDTVVDKGLLISDNSDFNNYTTNGIYYVSSDASSQTMTNIPVQKAGKLVVNDIFGGTSYKVQIYLTYEGAVYRRRYISTASTVWSTWEEFATGGVGSEAVLWEQENVLGAKNLFFNNAPSSFEKSGITFTTRSDGGVRVNGTATADMWVSLFPWDNGNAVTQTFDFGDYWLSGCPSNGSSNTYALYVQERNNADDGNAHSYGDYGGGCSVKIDTTGKIRAFIFVKSGTTLDKIFYPMIRLANIKNSTFAQPSWKNKDISQKLIAPLGKNILANANLNSFIEEGNYTIAYDATAATLTNRPCNNAGKLVVLKGRKNANLLQFYMRYDRNAGIYERTSDDGGSTWTSWGEYAINGTRNYNLNGLEVKQFSKPDNSGYPCYLLIADITTWYNSTTTGQARIAFEGILISTRDGYMADHLVHIGLGVSYQKTTSADNGRLILKSTSTVYRPYIITDGTKYYLSIGITGSGRTFRMFGRWENVSLINTWVNTTDSNGTLPSGWSIAINNNNHQWDETILGQGIPHALGMGYAYCSTAQNTLAKVASATGYIAKYGGIIAVYFANSVLANSTLSINEKTAYAIKYRGSAIGDYIIRSGDRVLMLYSDSAYHVIAIDRPRSVVTSRGSTITVTADGNKTVATLLQELRAKLITTIQNEGGNRAFRLNYLVAPWGIYMHIASPQWVYNNTADSVTIQASGSRATSDGYLRTGAISVTGSASSPTVKFYYNNKNASTDTFIDVTNNKPSNGDTFTISYDRYDYI